MNSDKLREDKNITFVARHYREHKFEVRDGWKRLGITEPSYFRRYKFAAAVAAFVAVSAAALFVYQHVNDSTLHEATVIEQVAPQSQAYIDKVIDFENAPLPQVAERIKEVYGVEVENLPSDAESLSLSLHYEGNAVDLVETINDILGTQIIVVEK